MTNADTMLQDPRVQQLIEQGAHAGALSYSQMNAALGDFPLDEPGAEALLDALEARGIALAPEEPSPDQTAARDAKLNASSEAAPNEAEPRKVRAPRAKSKRAAHSDLDEALASLEDLLQGMKLPEKAAHGGKTQQHDPLFADEEPDSEGVEDALRLYLNRMGRVPLLGREEEAHLAHLAREGSAWEREDARQRLTEANLRLVVTIARSYLGRRVLPMIDLIQEGNIGLMRAVDRFDPDRPERLGSYASWYIRDAIRKAVAAQERMVKIPSHLAGVLRKLQRLQTQLTQDLGRAPGHDELAQAAGLTLAQVEEAMRAGSEVMSLETSRGDDGDELQLGDLIAGEGEAAGDAMSRSQLRNEVSRALNGLAEREKAILQLRFGVGAASGDGPRSLEDIAAEMKLSRDRVRQLEVRALRKLRRRSRAGALQEFLGGGNDESDE